MRRLSAILVTIVVCFAASTARAQAFFAPGVVGFDPQISTVQSGTKVDVQAVVSYDRKYVTLTMQPQDSSLLALRQFPVQTGFQTAGQAQQTIQAMGFVGGLNPTGANPTGLNQPGAALSAGPSNSPAEIERRAIAARSVLSQRGIFLLSVQ